MTDDCPFLSRTQTIRTEKWVSTEVVKGVVPSFLIGNLILEADTMTTFETVH